MNPLETIFTNTWNRMAITRSPKLKGGLPLGHLVFDGRVTRNLYLLPTSIRTQHMDIRGKTGVGKTSFIRSIVQHDVDAGRGFLLIDQHGDLIPQVLSYIAARRPSDFDRVVVIDPGSRQWAVGLSPLETEDEYTRFREVAEVTRSLADRWDFKGARTEELLRNALFALSANGLTILETALFLSNDSYRQELISRVANQDVREYFDLRFEPLSDAMKATMREPALNKLSEFTADPHFRYILGQCRSTVSIDDVLARGMIVLVNLNKGQLGVHAVTFGNLLVAKFKAAIFRRRTRGLFTVFADEMQNLAASDTDFETLFAEARKFSTGLVTASQFGNQVPQTMRSAVQAIATRVFFQLSPEDAAQVAQEIDGGKQLADRLRNLPPRHAIVKSGHHAAHEIVIPDVPTVNAPFADFLARSNQIHARLKSDIDSDIRLRRPTPDASKEAIRDWE